MYVGRIDLFIYSVTPALMIGVDFFSSLTYLFILMWFVNLARFLSMV
jgi:hypothetical protein